MNEHLVINLNPFLLLELTFTRMITYLSPTTMTLKTVSIILKKAQSGSMMIELRWTQSSADLSLKASIE